jgi:chemosensory pili system protein ChpA (sensor histidine kinase/response regulator)
MTRTNSGNYDALAWVQDEVQKSLADALQALTQAVDSPDEDNAIGLCITQIHQIIGTMEMLSLQGPQLLATEILASAIALRDKKILEISAAQDSLLKSLLLLANYLKLVGRSLQDHPLRLIEIINGLRETRGVPVLDELALFKPSLLIQLPDEISPDPHQSIPSLSVPPNKLSQVFQISLLNWFKTNELASLQRMAKIVHYLRLNSIQERTIILWWVAEGVLEAILDNGLSATPATKIKIGTLNQSIKLFSNENEQHFLSVFPNELVHNLLLLVAHSTSVGHYVNSIKEAFNLDFFNALEHQKIYSFSSDALSDVNSELLFQLQEIKEHTDRLALNDHFSTDITKAIIEQLTSMSYTLELLEEQVISALLQNQAQQFQDLANQQQAPNDDQLMAFADDLLNIENLLQAQNQTTTNNSNDHLQLQQTVITECQHELVTVKETLSLLAGHPEESSQLLSNIASQLQLIAGSLSMLNLNEAASLFEHTVLQIKRTKQQQHAITSTELNLFADIIASADLYMDNLQHRGSEQSQLLRGAQDILDSFEQVTLVENNDKRSISTLINDIDSSPTQVVTSVHSYINQQERLTTYAIESNLGSSSNLQTSVQRYIEQQTALTTKASEITIAACSLLETSVKRYIDRQAALATNKVESLTYIAPSMATSVQCYINKLAKSAANATAYQLETSVKRYIDQQAQLAPSLTLVAQFADGIDGEIAEIFIEEANEVLAELRHLIPNWHDQGNIEVLAMIRRHFHTLKGSGYMAGANVIADLAKSVEHLLNRVTESNQAIPTQLSPFLFKCAELIPELLTHFTNGEMDSNSNATLLTQTAIGLLETETYVSEQDELQHIFNLEATQHIATFKQALSQSPSDFMLNKELLRAAHSLKGCANIAEVIPVAEVATQLDQSLRERYELGASLNKQQWQILSAAITGLDQYVKHIKFPQTNSQPDLSPFIETLQQLLPTDDEKAEQQRLIDPDVLAVFIEETDDLLSQYEEQLRQFIESANNPEIKARIKQTLEVLADNAQILDLNTLTELYHLLIELTQQANSENNDHLMLIELGSEEINLQIESLLQNKVSPDIDDFKHQVRAALSQIQSQIQIEDVEKPHQLFTIPSDDPDLLEAFTEECAELLKSSGEAVKHWTNEPTTQDAISQLQRQLHTLKGGARLAGITPIADLTHQIESLVFLISEATTEPNFAFYDLLQRSQDRLSDMHESLAKQSSFNFADDLMTEIALFSSQTLATIPAQLTEPSDIIPPASQTVESTTTSHQSHSDQIRVRTDLLDFLSNFAGEVSISRDRVGQQNSAIKQQLAEMEGTLSRLQDQLRNLEIETETQILFRYDDEALKQESDFDPLELDRFSMIQQLSRGLTETVGDMHEISQSLELLVQESDGILLQQSRLSTDLQQGLMNTRLIPFEGLIPRFERIVRQTNAELGKQSELIIHGANRELDRTIIDRIVAPIEHLLRNAIAHGIESVDQRLALGKKAVGTLTLTISREGSEVLICLSDDGQGINLDKVRQKAIEQNLINPDKILRDEDLIQLILSSGFSTADNISQLAGRGVGMDVVSNEIRALKGRLSIQSIAGKSTTFNMRLPLTLSVVQALLVSTHDHQYAIPLAAVYAGDRIAVSTVKELLKQEDDSRYEVNGEQYRFLPLSTLLNLPLVLPDDPKVQLPLLLFRYGEMHIALLVDSINSNREIVLKSTREQFSHITSITGATILGDGRVVFILDVPTLVETVDSELNSNKNEVDSAKSHVMVQNTTMTHTPIAMVVDDSITMRKASSNLLKRHGFDVLTARDGMDGVTQLNEQIPDIILLDVEMPRMDGFEFATLIRNTQYYKHIPIIMITSRTGSKHRDRGMDIGVDAYMGKPYQELELVETMKKLLGSRYPHVDQ